MRKAGDLEVYDIELEIVTPVFVGSGVEIQPNEYLYDPRTKKVKIIDFEKLFEKILEKDAIEDYEAFASSTSKDLERFLENTLGLTKKEINEITKLTIDSEDVSYRFRRTRSGMPSLQRIQSFARDPKNRPYVPGSSIKGALRTAILTRLIWDEIKGDGSPLDLEALMKEFENKAIEKGMDRRNNRRNYNWDRLKDKSVFPENTILSTLEFSKDSKATDTSRNIMRGISISDSEPLNNEDIILVGKEEIHFNGNPTQINIVREALRPGTKIKAKLTLDRKILKDSLTIYDILDSIAAQSEFLTDNIDVEFDSPLNTFTEIPDNYLILGGGAGFFSKTLDYILFANNISIDANPDDSDNFDYAVTLVRNYMTRRFDRKGRFDHNHRNIDMNISPHIKKYTRYKGRYYPMGYTKVKVS